MIYKDYTKESGDVRFQNLFRVTFYLGEQHVIHQRKVYDSMQFLGDTGGIFGSMMLIG